MTSLWLSGRAEAADRPDVPQRADVVVVGAGITGLTTAVLLARAGKNVVVLEARHIGAGATGNTTGKVSVLQGTKLSRIASKHGEDVLRAYATGNSEGRDWLLRYCDEHGVSAQREDAFSYAQSPDGVSDARSELDAGRAARLDVTWCDDADVPFPFHGGVRLADQAQIDPVPLLHSLAAELESHGGRVIPGARVHAVSGRRPLRIDVRLSTADAQHPAHVQITAHQCILATGIPILDRGAFFARVKPERSYCLAFDVPGDVTRSMFLSVDSPTRSIRYAPTAVGDKLVVGGAGHTVGRAASPSRGIEELAHWTRLHYPGAVQTHFWSAQDYTPIDELPYVGPLLPGLDTIHIATGFDKWGMTNGVAAALALSSRILGGRMDWSAAFASWRKGELTGVSAALQANLEVGLNLAKGWVSPWAAGAERPGDGDGVVSGPPWRMRADSVVDGEAHTTSPVCPHLGGVVRWNDADKAWECPLHGSRFAPDGELLEGPATRGLTPSAEKTSGPA